MQTFLPYQSYKLSMECLDDKRLGNQVWREGITLLRGKWPNHPAAKMWKGYERALAMYLHCGILELHKRHPGKRYDDRPWCQEIYHAIIHLPDCGSPPWEGDERVYSSHRANLLRKDPEWYGKFGWTEEPKEGYWWPVK